MQPVRNFWEYLPKPFFALAPMEDVTDTVFRELIASGAGTGKLHILFTEFMSVDGFLHDTGREKVRHRLPVSRQEREALRAGDIKLVAQIWGSDPEKFFRAGRQIAVEFGFDGIDINMGCPVRKIVKNNGCSALIRVPELAKEIVQATAEGSGLPVSIKTRIGFDRVETEEWTAQLLEVSPAAITMHGRTQKMQSQGSADWNEIRKAVRLRDLSKAGTLIVGNGDVSSYSDGISKAAEFGTDGIMVGRGIFNNPAFFAESENLDTAAKIRLLKKHIMRFGEEWEGSRNYAILKRFFRIYLNSFDGAARFRARMMDTSSCKEGLEVIGKFECLDTGTVPGGSGIRPE